MHWIDNKHNCVLSNAGLSNALTETEICTSLKSDSISGFIHHIEYKVGIAEFYLHMGSGADLLKMCSPEPKNCQNRNPHISKSGKLLPVCLTKYRRRIDHVSEPHAKLGENRWRIVDVIPNRIQIRNLHISKTRFLFPVSFTIAEFYLYMGFAANLLKNVVTRAWKLPKLASAHL